jgi:hypothetical protein
MAMRLPLMLGRNCLAKHKNPVVPFPVMPRKIRALIRQDWNALDPHGEAMMKTINRLAPPIKEFAHGRGTFHSHLQGTFGILSAWNQPECVRRCGLLHTAYSGDLFQFFLWDATQKEQREQVRSIVGAPAEDLVYKFGTINRGVLADMSNVIDHGSPAKPLSGPTTVDHRILGQYDVSERDAAHILITTVADYLDQMVDTNGWRDHHQVNSPNVLYPGQGKPAIAMYWFSEICDAIKDQLDVVPSVFEYCTKLIKKDDEIEARDAYWKVVLEEANLSEDEQIELLQHSIDCNPFVSEPSVLLSQIHYRRGDFHEAAMEARTALSKFYSLASAWDKRLPYEQWVAFTRVMLLRSNRKLLGEDSHFPVYGEGTPIYTNKKGLQLVSLNELLGQMQDMEDDLTRYQCSTVRPECTT